MKWYDPVKWYDLSPDPEERCGPPTRRNGATVRVTCPPGAGCGCVGSVVPRSLSPVGVTCPRCLVPGAWFGFVGGFCYKFRRQARLQQPSAGRLAVPSRLGSGGCRGGTFDPLFPFNLDGQAAIEKEISLPKSDAKLVERCLKGDARSWEFLLNEFSGRMFNMAFRYTGRLDIAEELTQEIFLKVFERLDSFRPESGALRNWIMRVGRNLIIDHYRATRKDKQVAGSEELEMLDFSSYGPSGGPFSDLYEKERAEFLTSGLQKLTPELKEAVVLRDIEGFSYREIATMLDIPDGTVKSRINRGRIELARVLHSMTDDSETKGSQNHSTPGA